MNKLFKKAMEVGYYFQAELDGDERIEDWKGTEHCATFTKQILDFADDNGSDIDYAFSEVCEETIEGIINGDIPLEDHGYDNYCRGFLAGQILGYPDKDILALVKEAEELWNDLSYGYYQEVLNEVKNS